MKRINQTHMAEAHTIENQMIFFRSQDEFARALREGIGAFEETGFME